jgi:hypothetical protein
MSALGQKRKLYREPGELLHSAKSRQSRRYLSNDLRESKAFMNDKKNERQ